MNKVKLTSILIAVIVLVTAYDLYANTSTVLGRITDANRKPAVGVIVILVGKYQYTDSNGRFRIRNVPFGLQRLEIQKGDEIIKEEDIEINDSIIRINIQL